MLQMLDSKKTGKQTKKVGQKPHPYRQTKKVGQKPHPYRQTKKVGQKPHPYRRNTKKLDKKKTGVNKHQLDKPADKRYILHANSRWAKRENK